MESMEIIETTVDGKVIGNWMVPAFRQGIRDRIQQAMYKYGAIPKRTSELTEEIIYEKAFTKDEYLNYAARVIIYYREVNSKNSWTTKSFRREITLRLSEEILFSPGMVNQSCHDIENEIYQNSGSKREYMHLFNKWISRLRTRNGECRIIASGG